MRASLFRNQAALPSAAAAAAGSSPEQRRQGKQKTQQQQQEQLRLLSRPSRRAEVILAATSLLPSSQRDDADSLAFSASSSAGKSAGARRRSLLATAAAAALVPLASLSPTAAAAAAAASASTGAAAAPDADAADDDDSDDSFYSSPKGFSLSAPPRWVEKSKPGAEVLFADPDNPRATIGVTASPVRIDALADFGTVAEVGDRLLGAELAKDGCLAATLRFASAGSVPREWSQGGRDEATTPSTPTEDDPSTSPSSPTSPSSLYYFEYELLTTRAHKVVVVAVGVASRTLYIFNGFAPCAKGDGGACPPVGGGGGGGGAPSPVLDEIRRSASTFSISPSKK